MRKYHNLEISQHHPKSVNAEDIVWADLILAMETCHADTLKHRFQQPLSLFKNKLDTFGNYLGLSGIDVEDPMPKGTPKAYIKCAKQLDSWTSILADKLNAQGKS